MFDLWSYFSHQMKAIEIEPEEQREQGSVGVNVYAEYLRVGANTLFQFVLILLILTSHTLFIINDWWLSRWLDYIELDLTISKLILKYYKDNRL